MHAVYGIRHHGPGSARSLATALAAASPDALVIEAPEELAELLPWLDDPALQPPVAALIWATEDSKKASFYPFAQFSPEWVALRWARAHGVKVYCMDLPMRHSLALRAQVRVEPLVADPADATVDPQPPGDFDDPINALAQAAGYADGESWWEHVVEARGHAAFEAITEAMAVARAAGLGRLDDETLRREAWMRQTLRAALKFGHAQVAVICGAFHAPVLTADALKTHAIKDDAARLKGLAKTKVDATWVPWSHTKFAIASGYGAGVEAPGWYAHLFEAASPDDVAASWLSKMAQALRAEDIDAPVASVIESVRLAQALATMRWRPAPDLRELREASLAVLCHGEILKLKLAETRLLGLSPRYDVLGQVPETLPQSPLQSDFSAQNRSLRLKVEALERVLALDLRQDADRAKSQHFWRLHLLGLAWATPVAESRGKGSFRETWTLCWAPEAALCLIDAGRYGGTIALAARARVETKLEPSAALAQLLALADNVLKAALNDVLTNVLAALDARAAVASDITELMAAMPPLIALLRYGDVRGTDLSGLQALLHGVLTRSCVALPSACAQLNADAALALVQSLDGTHDGLRMLADAALLEEWLAALVTLGGAASTPPLIAGRTTRLLLDASQINHTAASQRLSQALSRASAPVDAAAWLEGFLRGSVHLLLGHAELRNLIGSWLSGMNDVDFQSTLPLVRRAFSTFAAAERRLLLQDILQAGSHSTSVNINDEYDPGGLARVRAGLRGWLGQ
ncbi:MAG: DUF5682 family protein [Nevskia sp.]|jgi:hypothetical protein|nr:DUF5682 family protein [Nevskia sp.]MCK9385033.1 DUF5682 family protein [Nevskia sp.]